jgi:hypothetical protein
MFHFLVNTPSQSVVAECYFALLRVYHPFQHPAGRPFVEPACCRGFEADTVFLLQRSPVQARIALRFFKLLEYKVAFAVVMVEVIRVFRQATAAVVLAVIAVGRFKQVADDVGLHISIN